MSKSQSRVEEILKYAAQDSTYSGNPQSRVERLLMDVDKHIDDGGGGGGSGPTQDDDFDDSDVDDIISVIGTDND